MTVTINPWVGAIAVMAALLTTFALFITLPALTDLSETRISLIAASPVVVACFGLALLGCVAPD